MDCPQQQDDLADNFMNTQKGNKDGNTYTFRVNASDHNNETGEYITHIYAIDKGGNQTQLVLNTVTVADQKITLVSGSAYDRDGNLVKNVKQSTTVQSLLSQFKNESLEVRDKDGNVIRGTTDVGTGATINLYNGSTVVDSVTVVVLGDVDGNGIVDTTDYVRVKAAFLDTITMNEAERSAADVDQNGSIEKSDYMSIKSYFLRDFDLYG